MVAVGGREGRDILFLPCLAVSVIVVALMVVLLVQGWCWSGERNDGVRTS
jgi:hypothetical protein